MKMDRELADTWELLTTKMKLLFLSGLLDATADQWALSAGLFFHRFELLLFFLLLLLEGEVFLVEFLKKIVFKNHENFNKRKANITFPSFLGAFIGFFFPPSRPDILLFVLLAWE